MEFAHAITLSIATKLHVCVTAKTLDRDLGKALEMPRQSNGAYPREIFRFCWGLKYSVLSRLCNSASVCGNRHDTMDKIAKICQSNWNFTFEREEKTTTSRRLTFFHISQLVTPRSVHETLHALLLEEEVDFLVLKEEVPLLEELLPEERLPVLEEEVEFLLPAERFPAPVPDKEEEMCSSCSVWSSKHSGHS